MFSPPLVSLKQELRVVSHPQPRPTPHVEVEGEYHLQPGSGVSHASLAYCFPNGEITVGTGWSEPLGCQVSGVQAHWVRLQDSVVVSARIRYRLDLPFDLIERAQSARRREGANSDVNLDVNPCLGFSVIDPVKEAGTVVPVYANHLNRSPLVLPRDRWLDIIDRLGFTQVLVTELPVAHPASEAVKSALAQLAEARRFFAHGDLDEVGVRAFRAFEALTPGRSPRTPLFREIRDRYFATADPEVATSAHRLMTRLSRLYHRGGRHHGPPVALHHARFLLVCAEAIVAWCAELSA